MTDLEIIDAVEEVRKRNNNNWMNVLRLAFKENPKEARKLFYAINDLDGEISALLKKLAENDPEHADSRSI